jgi:hypothetical protein
VVVLAVVMTGRDLDQIPADGILSLKWWVSTRCW